MTPGPIAPRRGGRRGDPAPLPVRRLRVDLDGRRRQGGVPGRPLRLDPGGGRPGGAVGHGRSSRLAPTSSSRRPWPSGNNSPRQAGSQNGLTITKPLDAQGRRRRQGHDQARPGLRRARSPGTAPYLRDGGGNVVTISRQSPGVRRRQRELRRHLRRDDRVGRTSPPRPAVAFFSTLSARSPEQRCRSFPRSLSPASRAHGYGADHDQLAAGRRGRRAPRRSRSRRASVGGRRRLLRRRPRRRRRATTTARSGVVAYGNVLGSRVAGPVAAVRLRCSAGDLRRAQRGSPAPLTLTDAELPAPARRIRPSRAFSVLWVLARPSLANSGDRHRARHRQLVGVRRARRRPVWLMCVRRSPPHPARAQRARSMTLDALADGLDRRPRRSDRRSLRRDDLSGGRGRR